MSDLYEDDIVLWSEHQAQLLRRRAAGELVNDADLDWPNIAEEIEAVGNEQRFAVESLLVQAIAHRLKAEAWPLCRDVENWLADSMRLRGDAASRFVPAIKGISLTSFLSSSLKTTACFFIIQYSIDFLDDA